MAVNEVAGLPADVVTLNADAEAPTVTLRLDAQIYPLGALHAASYVFLDRCYVLLDAPDASTFTATLAWKKAAGSDDLQRLAGEFANECLACAWRGKIAQEGRLVIESGTARALAGAMGPPSLDDLESFDFGDVPLDDPLGIALSWEEKYGKKKKDEETK